jgi:hypothetical protein
VQQHGARDLPQERQREGGQDDEHGVLHRAIGLHVDVHRPDQGDPERCGLRLLL